MRLYPFFLEPECCLRFSLHCFCRHCRLPNASQPDTRLVRLVYVPKFLTWIPISFRLIWLVRLGEAIFYDSVVVQSQSAGGHLVSIHSAFDNACLRCKYEIGDQFKKMPLEKFVFHIWYRLNLAFALGIPGITYAYIGLIDALQNRIFTWIDGSAVDYLNWCAGNKSSTDSSRKSQICHREATSMIALWWTWTLAVAGSMYHAIDSLSLYVDKDH